jgi:NADPH2 dehydrogenase
MSSTVFSPLTLRGMTVKNRIVMSPMLMYRGQEDGMMNEFLYVHYAARALGGAGMIGTEVLAVEPRGRISAKDLGLWSDEQAAGLKRLVDFVHSCDTRIFAQLAHAGRKSHITETAIGPSAIAYDNTLGAPAEATAQDIRDIIGNYRAAARRAVSVGFDAIEIHAANGYLLHDFLAPVANARTDNYGGSLENRMRLALEVVDAVRAEMPQDMPLFYRIVAADFGVEGGVTEAESLALARELKNRGVDLIDVQTGNILPGYEGAVYPGYQTPYAVRIKAETGLPVGATGSIASIELAEYILGSGDADLVFMGRTLLRDPFWPIRAAKEEGIEVEFPIPTYSRATGPFERGF